MNRMSSERFVGRVELVMQESGWKCAEFSCVKVGWKLAGGSE